MNQNANADKIQSVLNGHLFPEVQNVAGLKQVLEFMEPVAQPLSQRQVKALLFLEELGQNKRLHPDGNPYENLIKKITGVYKKAVAPVSVYLETMEQVIPKPPKPIIMAEKVDKGGK